MPSTIIVTQAPLTSSAVHVSPCASLPRLPFDGARTARRGYKTNVSTRDRQSVRYVRLESHQGALTGLRQQVTLRTGVPVAELPRRRTYLTTTYLPDDNILTWITTYLPVPTPLPFTCTDLTDRGKGKVSGTRRQPRCIAAGPTRSGATPLTCNASELSTAIFGTKHARTDNTENTGTFQT